MKSEKGDPVSESPFFHKYTIAIKKILPYINMIRGTLRLAA